MSASTKRSGRQSAQAAEQTKKEILKIAAQLFCEQGFAKVSLRAISEKAGVSHSLIRHHFGSKLSIWKLICDELYQTFERFISQLLEQIPEDLPTNQRLFLLEVKLHAALLLNPQPMQLMADALSSEGEMFNYVFEEDDGVKQIFAELLEQSQQQGYAKGLTIDELKWLKCSSIHSTSTMAPLLRNTYPDNDHEGCLLSLHRLYSRMVAGLLDVDMKHIPEVEHLEDLFAEGDFGFIYCESRGW